MGEYSKTVVCAIRDAIAHLDYVVQRNWETLPEIDQEHPDVDLFVSLADLEELESLVPDWVDIRYPGDGYYQPHIERMLLRDPWLHRGWKIPDPEAYFISLYWHNSVHKKGDPYGERLRDVFHSWLPPIKAADEGVGFNGDYSDIYHV